MYYVAILVVPYINPANYAPRAPTGHTPGGH